MDLRGKKLKSIRNSERNLILDNCLQMKNHYLKIILRLRFSLLENWGKSCWWRTIKLIYIIRLKWKSNLRPDRGRNWRKVKKYFTSAVITNNQNQKWLNLRKKNWLKHKSGQFEGENIIRGELKLILNLYRNYEMNQQKAEVLHHQSVHKVKGRDQLKNTKSNKK